MKLALFLTPGAARTAYQVGAVKALIQEGGLRFDVIGASSVGTLNGAYAATGQVDRLAELWAGWRTRDITRVDWWALLRGAVLWAPNIMQNRPQKERAIDPHLTENRLLLGVRFRFNLCDLTTGDQEVLEWPGGPVPLAEGVNASVAVPAAIRPADFLGRQWADGLTVDGFPLRQVVLATGVDRVFVVGVAPRTTSEDSCPNAYRILLRAVEWNQYSEVLRGLAREAESNAMARCWADDRAAVERAAEAAAGPDEDLRVRLLSEIDAVYRDAEFPSELRTVEIVSILPEREIQMFFVDYRPDRSRALMALGRRDALRALSQLGDAPAGPTDTPTVPSPE